jgi:hypothetical protein
MSCVAGLAIGMSTHLSSQPQSKMPAWGEPVRTAIVATVWSYAAASLLPSRGLLPQILVIYRSGPCLNIGQVAMP